jgi:hypothetical protein
MRAGADFLATLHIPDDNSPLDELPAADDKASGRSRSKRPSKAKSVRRGPDGGSARRPKVRG